MNAKEIYSELSARFSSELARLLPNNNSLFAIGSPMKSPYQGQPTLALFEARCVFVTPENKPHEVRHLASRLPRRNAKTGSSQVAPFEEFFRYPPEYTLRRA